MGSGTGRSRPGRWVSRSAPTRESSRSTASSRRFATSGSRTSPLPAPFTGCCSAPAGSRSSRDLEKASYTGEELDAEAQRDFEAATGVPVCGMYGTTETGVILANYPGFPGYEPRPGALGKPLPGLEVAVLTEEGDVAPPGTTGEISVKRRGEWFGAKDLGSVDDDGYFHYAGRADDVIISAGWTISPLEVERALLADPRVSEAAVIGVPDELRGQVGQGVPGCRRRPGDDLADQLQQAVRRNLGAHEYPRLIEFVESIPKTPNGKVDRRSLREPGLGSAHGRGRERDRRALFRRRPPRRQAGARGDRARCRLAAPRQPVGDRPRGRAAEELGPRADPDARQRGLSPARRPRRVQPRPAAAAVAGQPPAPLRAAARRPPDHAGAGR